MGWLLSKVNKEKNMYIKELFCMFSTVLIVVHSKKISYFVNSRRKMLIFLLKCRCISPKLLCCLPFFLIAYLQYPVLPDPCLLLQFPVLYLFPINTHMYTLCSASVTSGVNFTLTHDNFLLVLCSICLSEQKRSSTESNLTG